MQSNNPNRCIPDSILFRTEIFFYEESFKHFVHGTLYDGFLFLQLCMMLHFIVAYITKNIKNF